MREQLQEQERREQQRQQAAQYPQSGAAQTPAVGVSIPASLPPVAQVPMEVLKVSRRGPRGASGPSRRAEMKQMSQSYSRLCVSFPPLELEDACVTVAA